MGKKRLSHLLVTARQLPRAVVRPKFRQLDASLGCVVVDDAFQGVTRVTRGQDLYHATHLQRLLQALLGYPAPRYDHHCLVVDTKTGQRLAKRDKSTTLRDIRDSGITATQLISTLPSFDTR